MERILIVGAGPVGLSAALSLAKKNISVTIVESESALTTVPKASTLHPPTLEIFEELGILEGVKNRSLIVDNFQYWDRRNYELVADLKLNVLKDETKFPYRFQCEQHHLTEIIQKELKESYNIDIIFDSTLIDIEQDPEKVKATFNREGKVVEEEFDFVIGADGASSIVRKSLGIPFVGLTYPQHHLLICVKGHDFTEEYPELAPVSYFSHPKEWIAIIQNLSMWKFLFPLDPAKREEDIDETYIQERIQNFSRRDKKFDIFHWVIYKAHQRVAKKFLVGRIAIIGDAAHVNNPLGGMGMNSGIHDAYVLANYLEKVWRGNEEIDFLQRFEVQRQHAAKEEVQKHTIKNEAAASSEEEFEKRKRMMEAMMDDREKMKDYLMETSMIKGFKNCERII
ncbi:3-(3-hydroxy-phenyl)propionate hydroxylase [Evansella vedderi]|uniref:3-(3-hydroxy-phenyl)propionate hydroxylase n=1 Tax=Evansella vedderi TaxID=38282 RepID=A0ABT9ZYH2_9BACI|nr:NAD(P)/FAD-dependent oxidoreductase [Evansella vedderi]MDQ0256296.1 3-(3-hydroxy-phenyl)propionate hydroxylase [Evansella vedderi]